MQCYGVMEHVVNKKTFKKIHTHIHTHICTYIHTHHTHIHTHTHTHTYTPRPIKTLQPKPHPATIFTDSAIPFSFT